MPWWGWVIIAYVVLATIKLSSAKSASKNRQRQIDLPTKINGGKQMKAFYYRLLGEDNPLLHYPELYEAALNEFAHNNSMMPSPNNILKEASMSKGSLYHNFGDKFGAVPAMMDMIVRKKTTFFSAALNKGPRNRLFLSRKAACQQPPSRFMHTDERLYQVLNHNLEASEEIQGNNSLKYFRIVRITVLMPLSGLHWAPARLTAAILRPLYQACSKSCWNMSTGCFLPIILQRKSKASSTRLLT